MDNAFASWRTSPRVYMVMKNSFRSLPGRVALGFLALMSSAILSRAAGPGVKHSFIAFGGETRIVGEDGKVEWTYPEGTRDGWVLPNGNILLTLSRSDRHRGEIGRAHV